ncbi:MAG TPA: dTDP-4-amino-4,6-dideoxygalactose transaminase [Verrucomicrobiae bacterium]|nr:dTDP-4-amino-4,6-dideoxygalactose transaminase [Verrucomicrobiae bacterium]
MSADIPFNRPPLAGTELEFLKQVLEDRRLEGHGRFTREAQERLEAMTGCRKALLTHSCTSALEMSALLCQVGPGDEVILPSYTFVSTASAVALRGATPVFVDIRPDTLNLDATLIASAITAKTKAIFTVHYAGIASDPSAMQQVAAAHGLRLVEDAAQCLGASYRGRPLGSFGDLATLSFHATKNITSGEGGALLINNESLIERAEIIWEKGTNRKQFVRGQVDKYTWVDLGSSYLPSEITAALLLAQLGKIEDITRARLAIWHRYNDALADLEIAGLLRRPVVPEGCAHNGHIYYVLLPSAEKRDGALRALVSAGVKAQFHYIPLHLSPAGQTYGRAHGGLPVTCDLAARLLRLPLWYGMGEEVDSVIATLRRALGA